MNVGRFYLQMASEPDKKRVLRLISQLAKPEHLIFIGVIDPIDPVVETAAQVRSSAGAASFIPVKRKLGTTDDCGFAPFGDDVWTLSAGRARKSGHGVEGTELAARSLGYWGSVFEQFA